MSTKEVEVLRQQIHDLESELSASIRREEMRNNTASGGGSLKQKIKNKVKRTRLWRAADDPDDKLGKIIRSPRTIMRILTNPNVAKEVREKNRHIKKSRKSEEALFMPIRFFFNNSSQKRINVILTEIDLDLIEMGIGLARSSENELRIIGTMTQVDAVWYRKMVAEKKLSKYSNVSFYNTVAQAKRVKTFELEVSRNDVFLTKAWTEDGR